MTSLITTMRTRRPSSSKPQEIVSTSISSVLAPVAEGADPIGAGRVVRVVEHALLVFARPDEEDRVGEELLFGVAIVLDRGAVDGDEPECLRVVHPRRHRRDVEQQAEVARLGERLGDAHARSGDARGAAITDERGGPSSERRRMSRTTENVPPSSSSVDEISTSIGSPSAGRTRCIVTTDPNVASSCTGEGCAGRSDCSVSSSKWRPTSASTGSPTSSAKAALACRTRRDASKTIMPSHAVSK